MAMIVFGMVADFWRFSARWFCRNAVATARRMSKNGEFTESGHSLRILLPGTNQYMEITICLQRLYICISYDGGRVVAEVMTLVAFVKWW